MASGSEDRRGLFWLGVKDLLPLSVGVISFGVAYGILATEAELSLPESALMSLAVFAGASQFVAAGMVMSGAGITPILITTLMVNSRHFLMSASLAPFLRKWKLRWRVLLSFLLADETYALTVSRFSKSPPSRYYMLGVGLSLYLIWALSSIVGGFLGSLVGDPQAWGLDFALPATFIVLVVPMLRKWQDLAVCLSAGLLSVAAFIWLPGRWYVTFASLVAVAFGYVLVELCRQK